MIFFKNDFGNKSNKNKEVEPFLPGVHTILHPATYSQHSTSLIAYLLYEYIIHHFGILSNKKLIKMYKIQKRSLH